MKKKRRGGFFAVIMIFITAAVLVRVLSGGEFEERAEQYARSLSQNEEFLRYAFSNETQLIKRGDAAEGISRLTSESAFVAHNTPEEAPQKIPDEHEKLTVWEYNPNGEKTANTYPVRDITVSPKSEKGYVRYKNIWVKNDSTKGIDLKWLLSAELPFKLSGKGPKVLIVHTHGSEAYFPQGKENYVLTDVERTSDKRYNVIRVGDELAKVLEDNGVSVVHDRNIYDSPSYNGSYTRTLDAIGQALKKNPSIKVVIDVHRDAMTDSDGTKYRTVADVNGKRCAQMMLVMSTGESGLPHPDWAENLKLAVKLQDAMAGKYPDIMRPINLRKDRFNMHATRGSMLVEVGTSANSVGEALESVRFLGKELSAILKTAKK